MPRGEGKMFRATHGDLEAGARSLEAENRARAEAQYNYGQRAQNVYAPAAERMIDPEAALRNRAGFEGTLEQTRAMIPGMAYSPMTPGYTTQEQQGMRLGTAGPIAGAYSSAQADLQNRGVRTGNAGAYAPMAAQLAHQRAMTLAPALAGLEGRFGDARILGEQFNAGMTQQAKQAQAGLGLNVAGAYGQQQSNEIGYVPQLFNFPAQSGMTNYGDMTGNQLTSRGQRYGALNPIASRANQAGLGARLTEEAMGNIKMTSGGKLHYGD